MTRDDWWTTDPADEDDRCPHGARVAARCEDCNEPNEEEEDERATGTGTER